MSLSAQIFARCHSEGILESARKAGDVSVGTESRNFTDVELRMVVQQVAGAAHADGLDEGLRRLAGDALQPLAELVGAHVHPLGNRLHADGFLGEKFVDDVHRLLQEFPVRLGHVHGLVLRETVVGRGEEGGGDAAAAELSGQGKQILITAVQDQQLIGLACEPVGHGAEQNVAEGERPACGTRGAAHRQKARPDDRPVQLLAAGLRQTAAARALPADLADLNADDRGVGLDGEDIRLRDKIGHKLLP